MRVIVTGLIAQYPLGGVTWDYLQYVLGLARLGHDVYYVEDTGQWPFNPSEGGLGKDCAFNVRYLQRVMEQFDLGDRWAYRFPWQSQWFGLSDGIRTNVIQTADLLINVSGTLANPGAYRAIPTLVYIDTDPVFTQVKLVRGQSDFRRLVDIHDVHFTFGERPSVAVPETGHNWRSTRQPIVIPLWETDLGHRDVFTTVMNWTSFNEVSHDGKTFGQKDVEFRRYMDLPRLADPTVLEVAANVGRTKRTPREMLVRHSWQVVDPDVVCPDLESYRDYIQTSKAEWSVAKNGYVVGQSGWFSCRSACYLAAGRPVVVQDTGFRSVLPTGEGIVPFRTVDEAVAGIRAVEADYARHAAAARAIANEWFNSDRVLSRLLDDVFATPTERDSRDLPTAFSSPQ